MAQKLQTRNTVFAINKEVTEGTPVYPSAGTDFTAFQDGFSVAPSFTTLTNEELQSSIGATKDALGFEEPAASVSHYIRHSGVEGTAPDYGDVLEAAIGSVEVEGTEYDTIAASTTSLIKVDSGEGANFARGQALLIKGPVDSNSNYAIRNISSISTDDLTLAQNVSSAPAVGVNLGKSVFYSPANSGHPTLTFHSYRANQGAHELIAGARPTSMTISATAGEFVNGSFDLEGISFSFDPIEITATSKFLDFTDSGATTFAVSVSEKTYKDPYELASALESAMNGTATIDTYQVSYDDGARKFTIEETSGPNNFSILWSTGANTANTIGGKLAFTVASDDTGAATYTADNAQDWSADYTPSYDSADPLVAKNNEVLLGDSEDIACFEASDITINFANTKADVLSICAESGKSGTQFTAREVTVDIAGYLEAGQAEEFKRYRTNETIAFTYNFGEKSGGNWVAGKCVNAHIPTATITSFELTDSDGIVKMDLSIKAFVSNGQSEFFLNFL